MKKINLPFTLLWPHPLPRGRVLNKLKSSLTKKCFNVCHSLDGLNIFRRKYFKHIIYIMLCQNLTPIWAPPNPWWSWLTRTGISQCWWHIGFLEKDISRFFFLYISISEFDPNFGPTKSRRSWCMQTMHPKPRDHHDLNKGLCTVLSIFCPQDQSFRQSFKN